MINPNFDIDTLEIPFSTEIDNNLDLVYLNFEKVPTTFTRFKYSLMR